MVDFGLAYGEALDAAQFGGIEIEQGLAADGLHLLAGEVDGDALAVGDHAQFAERMFHPPQLFAQRFQGAEDLLRGDLIFAQLDQGLKGDQVGEGIGCRLGNQALAFPTA